MNQPAKPFKAPEPENMEYQDQYLNRVVRALEDWINERFPTAPASIEPAPAAAQPEQQIA